MLVLSHTLVHPGIHHGQVANFKPGSAHLYPVLEVSERRKSDSETERVCLCSRTSMHKHRCLGCRLDVYDCEQVTATTCLCCC